MTVAELGRRLDEPQAVRLVDPRARTRLTSLDEALSALGYAIGIAVRQSPSPDHERRAQTATRLNRGVRPRQVDRVCQAWRCTDIGTRVITAFRLDHEDDPSWYDGPPYAVAEVVFDEDDMEGCTIEPEAEQD